MKITNSPTSTYQPAPEGIHSALCVDVIDLGINPTPYGDKAQLRIVFELESKMDDGRPFTQSQKFTASLHPKATLAQFLAKWRGKPIGDNETLDLDKLLGAQATLVISHEQAKDGSGKTFAVIDAISKATKKLTASGEYDPAAARQRIADYKAKQPATGKPVNKPAYQHAEVEPPLEEPNF